MISVQMDLRKKLEMESSIGLIVKLAEKSLERALDSELKERCNLTGGQWKVIIVLAISDGLTQKELASLVFVETSTLVPILDKMEKIGFVQRKSDPNDRRINRIYLTTKARRIVDMIVDCIMNFRKVVTKNISEKDLYITRKILKQMAQNADNLLEKKGIRIPPTILSKK